MSEGQWIRCWKCNTRYFLPQALYVSAKASPQISFFCPFGHSAHFPEGMTQEEKLRLERDRLTQRLAERDDEITRQRKRVEIERRSTAAYKGQVTKLRKRAKHGVCPCCGRTFQNLAAHMATKHPKFGPDDPLKVIEGGKP